MVAFVVLLSVIWPGEQEPMDQDRKLSEWLKACAGISTLPDAPGYSKAADAVQHLGTNGIFVFTGVPGRKGPVEIDTDLMMRNLVLKNQVVFGTVNAGRDAFEASIRDLGAFVDSWPEAVRSVITGRFPMDAHRDLLLGKSGGIKNVIKLN